MTDDYKRYEGLTFDALKKLSKDESLSIDERMGFAKYHREGLEGVIFEDIKKKLKVLNGTGKTVLDIGPGCGDLAKMIIDLCDKNKHTLVLIDSEEMLSQLPDRPFVRKVACRFPDCNDIIEQYKGTVDAILAYSVIHIVFLDGNPFSFIDKAASLLSEGGELLLGDIPNVMKRKRFFSSRQGIDCHKKFTGRDELPGVDFMRLDEDKIDDGVIIAILLRYRAAGFETYLLPQPNELPMATRREDILIVRR